MLQDGWLSEFSLLDAGLQAPDGSFSLAVPRRLPYSLQAAELQEFLTALRASFGTTSNHVICTRLPERPLTVVLLEGNLSKELAVHTSRQRTLDKLNAEQQQLAARLQKHASDLNRERRFYDLQTPSCEESGEYPLESLTLSSVGQLPISISLPATNKVEEDNLPEELDQEEEDLMSRLVVS